MRKGLPQRHGNIQGVATAVHTALRTTLVMAQVCAAMWAMTSGGGTARVKSTLRLAAISAPAVALIVRS